MNTLLTPSLMYIPDFWFTPAPLLPDIIGFTIDMLPILVDIFPKLIPCPVLNLIFVLKILSELG